MTSPAASSGPVARVLVVEDTPDIREVLVELLTDEGYEVHTADDGEQALEQLRKRDFDLMLLDLMMPRVDGITVLETLERENRAQPTIAMSAFERFRAKTRLHGVKAFLVKPVGVEQLLGEVASALAG